MSNAEKQTNWFTESESTNSYVALPLRGGTDRYHAFLGEAGEVFAAATNAFELHPQGAGTINTDGLNMAIGAGWLGLAGRVVKAYRVSHFDLIHSDSAYRDRLGNLIDSYPRLVTKPKHGETDKQRARRYSHEGHELVNTAVLEGVYTTAATYAVAPGVVRRILSGVHPEEQTELCEALLPSISLMNRQLARHSKQGNETFIHEAALPSSLANGKRVQYRALRYDPQKFAVMTDEHSRPVLRFLPDAHYDGDTSNYFSGCPALAGGSITRLNQLLAGVVSTENCYGRALAGAANYALVGSMQNAPEVAR